MGDRMLRFACAPTADLTLNQLRLALMNYVVATQRKEGFVIRIDDTDQKQSIEGKDAEIAAMLELFGIRYHDIVYQSKNFRFHSAMAIDLLHRKKAYNCFCKEEELIAKEEAAKAQKRLYSYDGTCKALPAELVIDNPNPFRVRIKRPSEEICFEDLVQGRCCFLPEEIDSFIILNVDKTPTHLFAQAVDDMLSDISVVIDIVENIENTPREIYVRSLLGYTKMIEYAHIPSLQDADIKIKELLEEGILPQAIVNYLLLLGSGKVEIFTLEDAKAHFDITALSKEPSTFDKEELLRINQAHLKALESKELSRYVGFADVEIGELAKLYVDEAPTTKELKARVSLVFAKKELPSTMPEAAKMLKEAIVKAPYFDSYEEFEEYLLNQSALEKEELQKTLYLLLNAKETGPKIEQLYACLKNYIKEVVV